MKILDRIHRWAQRRCHRAALFAFVSAKIWLIDYGYVEEAAMLKKPIDETVRKIVNL